MLRTQEMTFPGFKFQKFSGGVLPQTPPIHAWYIGHTHGLQPLLSPSNILSHRKVPFQKMPPPQGKILKKGPAVPRFKVILIILRSGRLLLDLYLIKINASVRELPGKRLPPNSPTPSKTKPSQ
jgi:hypothetical protein